jgi:hypothetical protein
MNFLKDLWAKILFWRAKKVAISERDFKFKLDLSRPNSFSIEIISKYPGVVVEYSNIGMGKNNYLHFDTSIVANPNNINLEEKKFNKYLSYIMMSIIASSVKHDVRSDDEIGTIDSGELDEERDIFEESDPVYKARISKRKPRKKAVRGNKKLRS